MIIKILKYNKKGSTILLMTVVVLSAILTVVLTASEIVRNGILLDKTQLDSTKAYFAAEAGAERILWEVRKKAPAFDFTVAGCVIGDCVVFGSPSTCNNSGNYNESLANSARYKVKYEDDTGSEIKLTCYGLYAASSRAVQLRY